MPLIGELLAMLRTHLGEVRLTYAESPQRLSGGFFTENHAFRLSRAPDGWDHRLVVRLFPQHAPEDLAGREACIQNALADQGFPAPQVLWFGDDARLTGRRFLVMRHLPGRALVGGIATRDLLRAARFARRLPVMTADVQTRLHRLDATGLAGQLGDDGDAVRRSVDLIDANVAKGASGLAEASDWLAAHRPEPRADAVVCHGDLWGGNILADRRAHLTGVLDWTTSGIGEPAVDVGATALAFCFVPIAMPRGMRALVEARGRALHRRYLDSYTAQNRVSLDNRPYYEALRCATELSFVASWRCAEAAGAHDLPRPSWDAIPGALVEYFGARTGVHIEIPPRARSPIGE